MVGAGWGGAGAVLAGLVWVEGLACGWAGDWAGRAGLAARGLGWAVGGWAGSPETAVIRGLLWVDGAGLGWAGGGLLEG